MDAFLRGKRLAMRFISTRMYTSMEIFDRLRRKGYESEMSEMIVSELIEEGFLDDKHYSDCYIVDSVNIRQKGAYCIKQELLRKGVSQSVVERAFLEADVDFDSALREFVDQRLRVTAIASRKDYEKFRAMLARRGYGLDEIRRVLSDYDFDLSD